MAEMLEHDADLLVAAFDELHFVPGVIAAADQPYGRGRGALAAERDAGAKLLFFFGGQHAFDLHEVSLQHVAFRGGDGV